LPLLAPHAVNIEDFEEIERPAEFKGRKVINEVKSLKRAEEICKGYTQEINSLNLSPAEALQVQSWYPTLFETEGYTDGQPIAMGVRVQYQGKLWETRQAHTITTAFAPSLATASLWMEVVEETADLGTIDNPIPYEGNMALEEGKYYSQDGIVYLCTRLTGAPVYNALKDLVGIYVELSE
jgi:hypothetical protein